MKKENNNTECAGFCAGKVIQITKTKPQFQKVTDYSCRPIRGLWKRGKRFYARVSVTDENGSTVDRRIPLKAKSVPEARLEYALVKSNSIQSITDNNIPSFSSFAPKYLYEIDGLKRPKTVELEKLHLKHLKQFFCSLKLNKISKQHVIRFRTAKIKGGWTGRTANLSITILNNLLNHAKDNGLIDTLPTTGLKPIRWKPKKRPLFAPEQIEAKNMPCRTPKLQTRAASGRLRAPHEDLWFSGKRNATPQVVRPRLGQETTDHRFRWPHQKP